MGTQEWALHPISAPGGIDADAGRLRYLPRGSQTTQSKARDSHHSSLDAGDRVRHVVLCSAGGVWQPGPITPIPIAPTSPTAPFPYAAYVPGLSYSVPNDGTTTTLTFCLAFPGTNACDATDYGSVAPYLNGCSVTDSGYNPVLSATLKSNPYNPNYQAAFDVTLSLAQTPPGTYNVGCTFWPAEPSTDHVWWQIQVVDGPPVVSYFQQYPPNPDGSFYVTLWGHNFGPDQGTIQACIQSGCSNGQMTVCLSASCGNAYYLWSDQQINALMQPLGAPDGTYNGTLCSYGERGNSSCLYVVWPFPFPSGGTPTLTLYQNGTNVTNVSQTAPYIVGQQLSFTIGSTSGAPINQSWSVSGGSYVGGYKVPLPSAMTSTPYPACLVDANAAVPDACIEPGPETTLVNMSLQTLTLYFTQPTSGPITITYEQGSLLNATSVSTTFNVVGPYLNGTYMSYGLGPNGIKIDTNSFGFPGSLALHYGGAVTGSGMFFYQSGVTGLRRYRRGLLPVGPGGKQQNAHVQHLRPARYVHAPGRSNTCVGLDTEYPYGPAGTETDSPANRLRVGDELQYETTYFNMFLMYQPNQTAYPNSIWVPVAVIPWMWSATVFSLDGGNTWGFGTPAPTASPAGNFYGNTTATPPLWNTVCPPSQTPPSQIQ